MKAQFRLNRELSHYKTFPLLDLKGSPASVDHFKFHFEESREPQIAARASEDDLVSNTGWLGPFLGSFVMGFILNIPL